MWGVVDEVPSCYRSRFGSCCLAEVRLLTTDLSVHISVRDGLFLFLAGRLPVHFSTVFPLERRDMVIDGAAERRLQAIHRDRCTWWRAMVPPWCIHSLVRSLVCRVDRRPAAASDLHRWLGGRCELPHEDDWVSSAGSRAQQTTC